jgi:uncharacterized membrane protein
MEAKNINKYWFFLFITLAGALAGVSAYRNFIQIELIDLIYYKVIQNDFNLSQMILFSVAGAVAGLSGGVFFHKRGLMAEYCQALAPLLLLLPDLFINPRFFSPILMIFALILTIFRLSLLLPFEKSLFEKISFKKAMLILSPVVLAGIGYGCFLQIEAMHRLYLHYDDWGIFLNAFDNTLKGKFMYSNVLGYNFLGQHFMLGPALMLIPFTALFRSETAFFVLNSTLLYGSAFVFYFLARRLKATNGQALLLALCFIFYPSISQLNLSLFYGFHPEYFFIPALMLFFCFYEREKYLAAIIIFLLSLTIKETIAPLWTGLGFCLFLGGKRKSGLFICIASVVYFMLITKVVMPWLAEIPQYQLYYRYEHLGNSTIMILLSPFLKPAAFFGSLFRPGNIYFVLLMLLPFFLTSPARPLLLCGALINFVFVCLVGTPEHQNIVLQYQVEIIALIFCVSAIAVRDVNANRVSNWHRLLLYPFKVDENTCFKMRAVLLPASLFCAVMCFFFFGRSVAGKNSFDNVLRLPDCSAEVYKIRELVPKGANLTYSQRLGPYFVFHTNSFPVYRGNKDYVVMDTNDPLGNPVNMDQWRDELLNSGKYQVIYNSPYRGHHFMLFKKSENVQLPPRPLRVFSEDEWQKCGQPLKLPPETAQYFEARGAFYDKNLLFFIRLVKPVDFDFDVVASASDDARTVSSRNLFGYGLVPAFRAKPGEVFVLKTMLPPSMGSLRSANLTITKR